jgi:hypothetical protein
MKLEDDHSPALNPEEKNGGRISQPPIQLHGVMINKLSIGSS